MNLADCYRLLGLSDGASRSDIKASYRRLARQCHPDVNVGDGLAQTKFIELTEAYKLLLNTVTASGTTQSAENSQAVRVRQNPPAQPPSIPPLSEIEYQLKWTFYERLQQLLKEQRFARAIALVEGLAQRIPQDPEVRQWQAIT
ncbi:J domain-containing protein, partial [Coleofasciculus sp.]|uniref:J domain-containing protein n=1 Tax=Coleofasciculus sp. TaxID=3100458 RepID=UPI003A246A4D